MRQIQTLRAASLSFIVLAGIGFGGCEKKTENNSKFGSIRIKLRGDKVNGVDPFKGTEIISVNLRYSDCLTDFFYKDHPEYQIMDSLGSEVFAEWEDRICAKKDPSDTNPDLFIDCQYVPESFEQPEQDSELGGFMRVDYLVLDDDLDDHVIRVGPIPREVLTECQPEVIIHGGTVTGIKESKALWKIATLPSPSITTPDNNVPMLVTVILDKPASSDDDNSNDDG